ncbi:L-threonylcarbamoyladenylate synthase [Alkalibacillus haloalkaliphilus]|uniref:Threonylcarbamoyl-AMP synthase n=1 Tax=Alkalibacillus haloalkaliphilus TaxID=94136 RepID=A0A511W0P3_9BACI|nr:L-threonylcarbamoyladenylate synthase [Alkalibacillus haloalkaliphilus]GEN44281.1 threonylcarbamoyl-AMP synthase [Alkalibacillus haloalkaliphilus]
METICWKVDEDEQLQNHPYIIKAAKYLSHGKTVAFPTETVYGLGADATDEQAVQAIFDAKGRPADNPLIVHVGSRDVVEQYVTHISAKAQQLIEAFWPGALTIILPSKGGLASNVTAGLTTVGVRMPDHPVALALLQEAAIPVAAPSANSSGKPSPTSHEHVLQDLNSKINGVVDGGQTGVGVESTVIDCTLDVPMILRPGGVTQTQIEAVIGAVNLAPSLVKGDDAPRSPGMKYKHYAPDCPIWVVSGGSHHMREIIEQQQSEGMRVGLMVSDERAEELDLATDLSLGSRDNLTEVTRRLYHTLRKVDTLQYDVVLAESFSKAEIGEALMNRLEKAATKII